MFKHDKKLSHNVRVDNPNPNYAAMLQEQLGGPHGELKAAMQYLSFISTYRHLADRSLMRITLSRQALIIPISKIKLNNRLKQRHFPMFT